jgi:hypothetical protein
MGRCVITRRGKGIGRARDLQDPYGIAAEMITALHVDLIT